MLSLTARRGPNSLGPNNIGAVPTSMDRGPAAEGTIASSHSASTEASGPAITSHLHSFLQELTSPLALASFASGIFVARVATGAYLARSTAWGWKTLLGAQAVGLGSEIATMTACRRLGAQVFLGAPDQWKPQELAQEMLLMLGPFALLRANHQAFAKFKLTPTTHLAGDVLAVAAGNVVNRGLQLEVPAAGEDSLLYSSLMTVAHMRLTGQLIAPFTSRSLDQVVRLHEQRLRSLPAKPPGRDASDDPTGWAAAMAGGPFFRQTPRSLWDNKLFTTGDGGSGGSSKKTGESQAPPSSARGEAILSELETRVAELHQEAARSPLNAEVEQAAGGLQGLLELLRTDPKSIKGTSFQKVLGAVRENLDQAKASRQSLQARLKSLGVFVEQVRNRGEVAGDKDDPSKTPATERPPMVATETPSLLGMVLSRVVGAWAVAGRDGIKGIVGRVRGMEPPKQATPSATPSPDLPQQVQKELEAVAAQVEAKEQQGTQMRQALKSLEALQRYLAIAAKQGLSEHAQWALNGRLVRLRSMFPNFRWEAISWAQSTGELAVRRNGVMLALGTRTPNMKIDTTLARRLRGGAGSENQERDLDSDLEVLQQGLLLGAGWRGSLKHMNRRLDRLVEDYGIKGAPAAVTRLAAETTHQLVMGKISQDRLLDFLNESTKESPLGTQFLALKIRLQSGKDLVDSLETFTQEANLENYFFSSLGLVLHSSKSPRGFAEELQKMEAVSGIGFHPSIAMGLFGAIHGQGKLPTQFLPKDFISEDYLNRAQEEFFQGTSDAL